MTRKIEAEVRKVIASVARLQENEVLPDSDIIHDLGIDSLGALEIAAFLESRYEVTLTEHQRARLRTLRSIVEFVTRNS